MSAEARNITAEVGGNALSCTYEIWIDGAQVDTAQQYVGFDAIRAYMAAGNARGAAKRMAVQDAINARLGVALAERVEPEGPPAGLTTAMDATVAYDPDLAAKRRPEPTPEHVAHPGERLVIE